MTRRIIIIDNKIQNENEVSIYLSNYNANISFVVKRTVSQADGLEGNLLFIHINNSNASEFISKNSSKFEEIFITSAAPSSEQLNRITGCTNVKVFDVPISREIDWKGLPWRSAIASWKDGNPFPVDELKIKHFAFPEYLVSAYLLLVAEQKGLIVNELDETDLWREAGRQFYKEVFERNLKIADGGIIPENGWGHPVEGNVRKSANAIRVLFEAIEGVKTR